MKGRTTSYQRFGSALGTTGSVVNKFIRSLGGPKGRDSEGAGKSQIDSSEGKGIYNQTIKSEELVFDFKKEFDLGEAVYGCISASFGEGSGMEIDSNAAIKGRKTKRNDSPHFKVMKREWYHDVEKKSFQECAAIPQENLPLTVNSKFEMNFWDQDSDELTQIPKGIGFTSGALIRPVSFSDNAMPIKDGFGAFIPLSSFCRAHILKGVPLETAHGIINRCKEISLIGSASYSISRANKRCGDGPTTSTKEWEGESVHGCPPGDCRNEGGKLINSCLSGSLNTTIELNGDIKMTAYRHKQVADIWEKDKQKQKTLDISGNVFIGTLEDAALTKKSVSLCEAENDDDSAIPTPKLPPPTLKQLIKLEKQKMLSSGCLVYPATNNSIIIAKEDTNLKTEDLDLQYCKPGTAKTVNILMGSPQINQLYLSSYGGGINIDIDAPLVYPGGAAFRIGKTENESVRPFYVSGPSLQCYFAGIGWDYSEIGKKDPEALYNEPKCTETENNFYDWKMTWRSTNLKKTVTGLCPQGFEDVGVYDAKPNSCECDDDCKDCAVEYGKLRMSCECQPICKPDPDAKLNPCADGHKNKIKTDEGYACDGVYSIGFSVGKYVGVQREDAAEQQIYNVAPVPLRTSSRYDKTEDLVLWWSAYVSERLPYEFYKQTSSDLELRLYANKESADYDMKAFKENSFYRYELIKAGSLKLLCDEWSTSTDIWVIHQIRKETSCSPSPAGAARNYETRTKIGVPYSECNDCGGPPIDFCCSENGCGGGLEKECCEEDLCGKSTNPCEWAAEISGGKGACYPNTFYDCGGDCVEDPGDCGCCGCNDGNDDCEPCKAYKACKPYRLISDFEPLSCYGDAYKEDRHQTSVNLTIEFILFEDDEKE
jgi:hypothetical protein